MQTMDKTYYETINKLEQMDTDREYIQGWIGGYMGNPKREEQRRITSYNVCYTKLLRATQLFADISNVAIGTREI